jgi:hypothetical protein
VKTDDLISMLATGDSSVAGPRAGTRYAMAGGLGAMAAGLMMLVLLQLRHDLLQAMLLPMFWVKIGFVACVAGASLFAVLRLSRPGASLEGITLFLALPVLGIWAIAAYSLINADPAERSQLFFGDTWTVCPLLIALLSLPVYLAVFRVMQDMAPTRPRTAGFAAGLLSGAIAATVYCLHCPEMGAPFIGFWYLLGMLVPAVIGAWQGNSRLRW